MANIAKNKETETLDDPYFMGVKRAPKMFETATVNEWLRMGEALPPLNTYFSEFLSEGDVLIMYGEPGSAKSLTCVCWGQHIAEGTSFFPTENKNPPQTVLYADGELNVRQFTTRYRGVKFSPNFYRCEFNPEYEPKDFEKEVIEQIEQEAINTGAKVVIVDNLTWLLNETEKGTEAGKLMKSLQKMKNRLGITLIVVAHTPKRSGTEPLGLKDIAGSSRLGNFTTSAVALGKSIKDEHLRYMKCTKTRNSAIEYGSDNVILYQISTNSGMLGLEFVGYDTERNHLAELPEQKRLEEYEAVKDMYMRGQTQRDIAVSLGCSLAKINGIIKKIKKQ
jgi:RecA-family ATPase